MSNKIILNNTIALGLRTAIAMFLSLYISRLVLEILGVVDYGVYSIVGGFVVMFGFLNTSLSASIQRFYNSESAVSGDDGTNHVYTSSCIIQSGLAFIVLILVECVGLWYLRTKIVIPDNRIDAAFLVFHISVISLLFVILQVPFLSLILSKEKMRVYSIVGIIDVIAKLCFVIILQYVNCDKLTAYAFGITSIVIINSIIYYLYCKKNFSNISFTIKNFNYPLAKQMLFFSTWNAIGAFSSIARTQGLNIILNLFFGPVVNGARNIAYQIQAAIMGLTASLSMASRPQLVHNHVIGNAERADFIFKYMSQSSYILTLLFALPIYFNIDYILLIWLGSNVPDHTASFTILILISSLIESLNAPVTAYSNATGKVKLYCSLTAFIVFLVIPLSYLFLTLKPIPEITFIVYIFVMCIVQIASVIILSRYVKISLISYVRSILIPLLFLTIVGITFTYFVSLLSDFPIFKLIITSITSLFIIPILSYFIVLNVQERKHMLRFIKSKLQF